MSTWSQTTLWREAKRLRAASNRPTPLPPLWFLTDASRVRDPVTVANHLPAGTGIILRDYDLPSRRELAMDLLGVARARELMLLIGKDEDLCLAVQADGLHLPEGLMDEAPALRHRHPDIFITAAAHGLGALGRAARAGVDAAFLSPVFATQSHAGAPCLGPIRAARMARQAALPVFALGGIDRHSVRRLQGGAFSGVGAIGALATASG
ncbi:MAG: thiamine phosphate synthase [Alphaproteobacteria bacterium]